MQVETHLVVDRYAGLAWGRLDDGWRYVELIVPRLPRVRLARGGIAFLGRAVWVLWPPRP